MEPERRMAKRGVVSWRPTNGSCASTARSSGAGKLGIAAATVKKYGDDQSSSFASSIAFWAFFSIFPLLLTFVTIPPASAARRYAPTCCGTSLPFSPCWTQAPSAAWPARGGHF